MFVVLSPTACVDMRVSYFALFLRQCSYIAQDSFQFTPTLSTSWVLGLQECTTIPDLYVRIFKCQFWPEQNSHSIVKNQKANQNKKQKTCYNFQSSQRTAVVT